MKETLMLKKISLFIATFFGAGLSPKAPGTMGSLATLPFAFLIACFLGFDGIFYSVLVIFIIGTIAVYHATKDSPEKDPGKIVIDETAGQLTTFILATPYLYHNTSAKAFLVYLIGFGLFRLFDIFKIGPVKWADTKLKNACGVMLDDIFAGIFAALVLMMIIKEL